MKHVGTLFLGAMFGLLVAATGCGDDGEGTGGAGGTGTTGTMTTTGTGGATTGTGGGTTTGTGGSGGGGNPAAPKLGKQIDRFGRPAINTALNHTFAPPDMMAAKDAAKDKYNQDSDPDNWGTFVPEFQKNLAILDALDTNCGNQLLADAAKNDPSRYTPLAAALAGDQLWVRTDSNTCSAYLGVEADATGIQKNTDCGGRTLAYDVIDISYSALATGNPGAGVGDGVPPDADTAGTAFPYLAAPH